jgi:hypothetical protein
MRFGKEITIGIIVAILASAIIYLVLEIKLEKENNLLKNENNKCFNSLTSCVSNIKDLEDKNYKIYTENKKLNASLYVKNIYYENLN